MKKAFILFFSVSSLMVSCKQEIISPNTEDEMKTGISDDKTVHSAADGKLDLLGYGYDLTGDHENSNPALFSAIDVEKLKNEHPDIIENLKIDSTETFFEVGGNAFEFLKNISSKKKFSRPEELLFKGLVDFNFSNADKWSSKYIYGLYSQRFINKRILMKKDKVLLMKYLNQQFIADINRLTAAELVKIYGTHILTDFRLGGKMEVIYQAETNNNNRSLAAAAGTEAAFAKVFGVRTPNAQDELVVKNNYNQNVTIRTIGGASEKIISGIKFGTDGSPIVSINVPAWKSGITDNNAELIEINDAIPLYELITDPAKKSQVQNYITEYFKAHQVTLTTDVVYIFENAARKDYALSTNINTPQVYPGWAYSDVVFKAYTYNPSVAQPIYSYINNVNGDHAYTTTKITLADWVAEGIPFYAYSSQVPGTVPVYQFYNSANTSHYYSTNRNATSGYAGWAFEGVCFYAFPIN